MTLMVFLVKKIQSEPYYSSNSVFTYVISLWNFICEYTGRLCMLQKIFRFIVLCLILLAIVNHGSVATLPGPFVAAMASASSMLKHLGITLHPPSPQIIGLLWFAGILYKLYRIGFAKEKFLWSPLGCRNGFLFLCRIEINPSHFGGENISLDSMEKFLSYEPNGVTGSRENSP